MDSRLVFLRPLGLRLNDKTAFRAGYARYAVQWLTIHPETGGLPTWGFSQTTNVIAPLNGIPQEPFEIVVRGGDG